MKQISIFWFRRDLRLFDNKALHFALNSNYPVKVIFIFDPNILGCLDDKSDKRVSFIYETLQELDEKLKLYQSNLFIYYDKPLEVFKKISQSFLIKSIFLNEDYEPYAKKRDLEIEKYCKNKKILFQKYKDHCIFSGTDILKSDGSVFKVYTPYMKKWNDCFSKDLLKKYEIESYVKNFFICPPQKIMELSDVGFVFKKLNLKPQLDINILKTYKDNRNFLYLDATSKISIFLRFGLISIREAFAMGFEYSKEWVNQLIWREFYMMILDNYPFVVSNNFNSKYDKINWSNNIEHFESWKAGKTGFPIIDAAMRELEQTGYMHNRARMITASFLVKLLLIDWKWGADYFAKKLLDFELSSNNGGWQWAAGTGTDAQPYFRIFNPYLQTKKFDPNLDYIYKWIPELDTSSYSKPIINYDEARRKSLELYKKAIL